MKYTCSIESVQQNGRFTIFLVNSTLNIYSFIYYIYSLYNTDILILYNYNFRDSSESESETQSAPVLEDLINIESTSRSNRRAGLRESERLVARFIFPSSANKTPKTVLRIQVRILLDQQDFVNKFSKSQRNYLDPFFFSADPGQN